MKKAFKVISQKADKSILLLPQKPVMSLIWLHGLGDTSAGFADYFQVPQSPLHCGARVKLLHAPIRPVTVNGGMSCPSWYDIKILDFSTDGTQNDEDKRCSLKQVRESLDILDKHVEEEADFWRKQKVQGDVYKRIFVGGFSQGCAISLLYGLTSKKQIAGVIGFSGYLFQSFEIPNLGKIPILLNHGRYDSMIPIQVAKQSYKKLKNDASITFKQKNVEHSVDIEQIQQMTQWISSKLQAK